MSTVTIGTIISVLFLFFLVLGMPIGACMGLFGILGYAAMGSPGAALNLMVNDMFTSFASYNMSTVVMFCWMGFIAYRSGIGDKLFELAYRCLGHLPGGLCIAAEAACAMFGAVCGSAPATVATIGSIAFPEMKKYGYNDSLRTACVAAGGGLGILIPPSMTAIIYGITTGVSIGKLFIAGISAGILLMLFYMAAIYLQVKFNPALAPRSRKFTWSERKASLGGGLVETIIIFVLSIGGLSVGFFTPTEGGAIGCFLMLALVIIRKKLSRPNFLASLKDTAEATGMIMWILGCATLFSRMITISNIPQAVSQLIENLDAPPGVVILTVLFVYLVAGCFIDAIPMITITVPIFYPIVTGIGYDPIWYGVVTTLTVCMGMITPPVGAGAFVARGVAPDVPLQTIFKGIWPFLLAMFLCLTLVTVFPQIVLFLVN
ncbi:MAG: TRAP transporter large permease [Gracilibacteraceae bacterium]|jgi:tripartite ATP-independent transporter DctM subunit|nr:TRAP transporter large permease [Gracilibacteraceae bacterium]